MAQLRHRVAPTTALVAVLAGLAAATPASADIININFENSWPYGDSVGLFYASQGLSFSDTCLGLSNNDGLGSNPDGSYYANAPSPLGVLNPYYFTGTPAVARPIMTISPGATGALTFWYSSPEAITGAIVAYSGPDGTGSVLGTVDLAATFVFDSSGFNYNIWSQATLNFSGIAQSFDFTGAANVAGFDDFSLTTIPTPAGAALFGLGGLLAARRRRNAQ